jgi:hypothetical protein
MEYVFRTRILIGGVIAFSFLSNPDPIIMTLTLEQN